MSESEATTQLDADELVSPAEPEGIEGIEVRTYGFGLVISSLIVSTLVTVVMLYGWIAWHPRWVQHEQLIVISLIFMLTYLGIIDAITRRISNLSNLLVAIATVGLLVFTWFSGFHQAAVTGALIGLLLGVLLVAAYLFSRVKKMGGGDVKLIPSVVALLGTLNGVLPSLWLFFMLVFALIAVVVLKKMGKRPVTTLAPMMALGLIPTFWYFSEMSWALLV